MRVDSRVFTEGGNEVTFDGTYFMYHTSGGMLQVSYQETQDLLVHFGSEASTPKSIEVRNTHPVDEEAVTTILALAKSYQDAGWTETAAAVEISAITLKPRAYVADVIHHNGELFPRWA